MKRTKDKDLEDFLKSHHIAQSVEQQIREDRTDGLYEIGDSHYKKEFIETITSEECFEQTSQFLEKAYQQRDIDGFMKKIREKEARDNRRKRFRLVVTSASVAAALVILSMNLLKNDPEMAVIAEKIESEITVPTLIVQDSMILLDGDKGNALAVNSSTEKLAVADNIKNRLVVPSGYQYTLILSDSTEVIVNAGSELSYTAQFHGDTREVELKGEAYFKVKKSDKPFIVTVETTCVKVYGTQFNINSYNKGAIKTVLVSGSVGLSTNKQKETMMKPNQMITTDRDGNHQLTNVNTAMYTAWLNGEIVSDGESLTYFLDNVAKWYGVEFVYSEEIRDIYINAEIKNSRPLEEVLESIKIISNVKIIKTNENKYMIRK